MSSTSRRPAAQPCHRRAARKVRSASCCPDSERDPRLLTEDREDLLAVGRLADRGGRHADELLAAELVRRLAALLDGLLQLLDALVADRAVVVEVAHETDGRALLLLRGWTSVPHRVEHGEVDGVGSDVENSKAHPHTVVPTR
jgi:hypothetical protein